MIASPKFLNVCLPKSVVSVVLSKILARNVYVSRLCSLGENSSKAKIFKCMSPKVRSSCSFVKNPCKKYMCVYFVLFRQKQLQTLANTCKHLQPLANTCKLLQKLANARKHLQTPKTFANTCKYLQTLENTLKHLKTLENICKHLQTLVNSAYTCKHLQTLANTCKHLTHLQTL